MIKCLKNVDPNLSPTGPIPPHLTSEWGEASENVFVFEKQKYLFTGLDMMLGSSLAALERASLLGVLLTVNAMCSELGYLHLPAFLKCPVQPIRWQGVVFFVQFYTCYTATFFGNEYQTNIVKFQYQFKTLLGCLVSKSSSFFLCRPRSLVATVLRISADCKNEWMHSILAHNHIVTIPKGSPWSKACFTGWIW